MRRRLTALAVTSLSLVAVAASLGVGSAAARSPKCYSVQVAGQPGVFIGHCTTNRA